MGQVTAFTAEKTLELIGESIVGARLEGYNLILTTKAGADINLGSVRGAIGPNGGISESAVNALIAAAANDEGKGIVAFDESTTEQVYSFAGGDWVDITGVNVSHTFIPGRSYQFNISGALRSAFDGNTRFALGLRKTDDNSVFVRAAGFSDDNTWLVPMNGSRTHIAEVGWGTRGYKLSAFSNVEHTVTIESDIYPAQISIVDLGVL